MKKSNKELEEKYRPRVVEPLVLVNIRDVNHRPHVFMVGPKHVAYAEDHCGGRLDSSVMEKIGCAHPHCHRPLSEHECDTMVLRLTRNCTNAEVWAVLGPMQAETVADGIKGVCFVETPEKFRVQQKGG